MDNVRVVLVNGDDLPTGNEWCALRTETGDVVVFFDRDRFTPDVVARAWVVTCREFGPVPATGQQWHPRMSPLPPAVA